ncbi:thioredoxin family protein [Minwuia thermotolerans]|uniref:Thioredoxin family protein n=1 Tax=Minwuia thermotolerans TaxID=2056226 RepID=A0A2M9FZT3_9PROT|nr:thioredoxin family protein [Minwuia thermotolerans]PJK28970.1 thioredoxin family protein [Minwuia thermotolerans]
MALTETPAGELGWTAADFSLPEPGGETRSLADLKGENGTVIAFICNHCPYVKAVAEDLAADARELERAGVATVGIMPNDYRAYPDDAPEKMAAFAAQHGFDFPYLIDESQEVAKAYRAVCTPDLFGFDRDLKLVYRGRLAEGGITPKPGAVRDLVEAMKAVAAGGEAPADQVPSMGCSIKWKPGNAPD